MSGGGGVSWYDSSVSVVSTWEVRGGSSHRPWFAASLVVCGIRACFCHFVSSPGVSNLEIRDLNIRLAGKFKGPLDAPFRL